MLRKCKQAFSMEILNKREHVSSTCYVNASLHYVKAKQILPCIMQRLGRCEHLLVNGGQMQAFVR